MKAPKFWYRKNAFLAKVLKPVGYLYGFSVARRFKRAKPYQAAVPVICVGNLSVGGTGKTPVCLALGKLLREKNISFFFLNHGYKSKQHGVIVQPDQMTAIDVGDEALLLAAYAPTVVDQHRARGAQLIQRQKTQAIIMDDGFQNPGLIKTLSFIVVDGHTGFGNGCLIPAGPLRESVDRGLMRADAVIIVGRDETGIAEQIHQLSPDIPVLSGHFQPNADVVSRLQGKAVAAFAGIGRPDKFFNMLIGFGIPVAKKTAFPDHCFYTRFDIEQLLADAGDMPLVTTTKDFVKIPRDLQSRLTVVSGDFVFDSPDTVWSLLEGVLGT